MNYVHSPVMGEEILNYLIKDNDRYFLDCTLGEGGHSEKILTRFSKIVIYGLDRDAEILAVADKRLSVFRDRFQGFNRNFKDLTLDMLKKTDGQFDAALIDLGISLYHYKKSGRGFSFSQKEKLDMRLDHEGLSAADIVNTYSEEELTEVFFTYAEERFARKIAARIVAEREKADIIYAEDLADIIDRAIPARFKSRQIHPATKCFQALRMVVNKELDNIRQGIPAVFAMLKTGGRLGVISFHSIEDRAVKEIFARMYKSCICPPELPVCTCGKKREINYLVKALTPTENEIRVNPASRSAKLRIVEKL